MPQRVTWTFFAKNKFTPVANAIKRSVKGTRKEFEKLNKATKKVAKGLKKAGQAMTKFSAIAAVAVVGSLKTFADMEKGLANVFTLMSDDEFKQFGKRVEGLATSSLLEYGFSIDETTKALFELSSRLGTNEIAMKSFNAMQRLAIGGVTTLETSVIGIAGIMNAYKDEMLDANDVGNAFFAAQKKGATDVSKLAANVGQVSSIAKTAGIGYRTLLATMAQLTTGSLSTEEATTALKGAITSLIKPSTEAFDILSGEGVPVGLSQVKEFGIVETFRKLNELFKTNPDLLVRAIPNIRGFTAVTSLSNQALDEIIDNVKKMSSIDQLDPAFKLQMLTTAVAMNKLRGAITIAAIQLGEQFVPAFNFVAGAVKKATTIFGSFSDRTKKWIAVGIGIVAILAPLLIGLSAIAVVLGPGIAAISFMVGAIGGLPVVLGLATAALIRFVSGYVWDNFDKIKGVFGSIKSFMGFGNDDGKLDVSGAAAISNKSQTDINLNVTTPKGTTAEAKAVTIGSTGKFNMGMNMEGMA